MFNLKANTISVFEMMEHAIPHLKTVGGNGGASIINVSSVNGLQSLQRRLLGVGLEKGAAG